MPTKSFKNLLIAMASVRKGRLPSQVHARLRRTISCRPTRWTAWHRPTRWIAWHRPTLWTSFLGVLKLVLPALPAAQSPPPSKAMRMRWVQTSSFSCNLQLNSILGWMPCPPDHGTHGMFLMFVEIWTKHHVISPVVSVFRPKSVPGVMRVAWHKS